jgi:hypothetical protein
MEQRKNSSRIRLLAQSLKVEKGGHQNIPKRQQVCIHCNVIEDEYHFILTCPLYFDLRNKFIKKYYWFKPSTYKLIQFLSTYNVIWKFFCQTPGSKELLIELVYYLVNENR